MCERKGEIGYNLMDWVIRMQYGNEFIYRREEWEVKDLIYRGQGILFFLPSFLFLHKIEDAYTLVCRHLSVDSGEKGNFNGI